MILVAVGLLCMACGIVVSIAATLWIQEVEEHQRPMRPHKDWHPYFGWVDR